MTPPLDVRLTTSYQHKVGDYRARLGALAARAWTGLSGYDRANIAELVAAVAIGEAAARRAVTHLTGGYLSLLTGERIDLDPRRLPTATALWQQPFLTTWGQLGRGIEFDRAVAAGRDRAQSTGAQIISHTARAASALFDDSSNRVTGWRRVPSGDCCAWCVDVAGELYSSADAAALGDQHANCSCDVIPATDATDPGAHLNARRESAPADARYVAADGTAVTSA